MLDRACVMLTTSDRGRIKYRVTMVRHPDRMYLKRLSDSDMRRFFNHMALEFCGNDAVAAQEFALHRTRTLNVPDEVSDILAAQVLSDMLENYSSLPIFFDKARAQYEVGRLLPGLVADTPEHGVLEVDMTVGVLQSESLTELAA